MDEDAKAAGLNNRDDMIKRDCISKGNGLVYNGNWQDCGGWKYKGECSAPNWGDWRKDECVSSGKRKNSARLWNIVGDWGEACTQAIQRPGISGEILERKCVNTGPEMWGEVYTQDDSCNPVWGSFRNECSEAGTKKYFAQLDVLGMDWQEACRTAPPVKLPNGVVQKANCVKRVDGQYGEWLVPDSTCSQKTNADLQDFSSGTKIVSDSVGGALHNVIGGALGGLTDGLGLGGSYMGIVIAIILCCICCIISSGGSVAVKLYT